MSEKLLSPTSKNRVRPNLLKSPSTQYQSSISKSSLQTIRSPTAKILQTSQSQSIVQSNSINQDQSDLVKTQLRDLYLQIQTLNEKKQKYLNQHKEKYLKQQQTEKLITDELNQIQEKFKDLDIRYQAQFTKLSKDKNRLQDDIGQLEKENFDLKELNHEFTDKTQQIDQLIRGLICTRDQNGNFKHKIRQIEENTQKIQQIDSHLQELELIKKLQVEQDMMIHEDIRGNALRITRINEEIQWKKEKVQKLEKINTKKPVVLVEIQTEKQLIDELYKQIEFYETNHIFNLETECRTLGALIENQDQILLENLNSKESLLQKLRDLYKYSEHPEDQDLVKIQKLKINKAHFDFKITETQEKMQTNLRIIQEKVQLINSISKQMNSLTDLKKMEVFKLSERQMQLNSFMGQLEEKVKPSIEKLNQKIKDISIVIDQKRITLITLQQLMNKNNSKCDYQQISQVNDVMSLETYKQFMEDETLDLQKGQCETNIEDKTLTLECLTSKFTSKRGSQPYSHDPAIFNGDNKKENNQNQNESLVKSIIIPNNPNIMSKIMPLINGMEVYKKTFDTKLLTSVTQQQKYNMIADNKRLTPELIGYSIRIMKISKSKKGIALDFINPLDDLKKVDLSINLKKSRLVIPKETQDAVKLLRNEKEPLRIIQEQCQSVFDSTSIDGLKRENTFIRDQRNDYEGKCKKVDFFSFAFVYDHKETDICISNAGGHYNFILIREALEALLKINAKDEQKIKQSLK
ncbi:UNKNOWN [Stylonychia lemnae]|uniref:Uncharacterized protein n=1 Tax=Stylonychia lemnae TaxID=5949 RepID=A0A078B6S7_STYLE|nr:UNKNOWN [Stylonychia lemnae]|eukprot:CDW90245.1 UNKNOWN [Stylonychia lemnae]